MRARNVLPALLMVLAACGGEKASSESATGAPPPATATPSAPVTSTQEAVASLPEEAQGPFKTMMVNYAAIQASLAGDSTSGVVAAANAVKTASRELEAQNTDPVRLYYMSIATEAEAVAANAADITMARKSFGELSKSVIRLLVAKPDLAKGYTVVECPMTSTYKKWLQTDENVRNPYYGATMLECGTISKLEL